MNEFFALADSDDILHIKVASTEYHSLADGSIVAYFSTELVGDHTESGKYHHNKYFSLIYEGRLKTSRLVFKTYEKAKEALAKRLLNRIVAISKELEHITKELVKL